MSKARDKRKKEARAAETPEEKAIRRRVRAGTLPRYYMKRPGEKFPAAGSYTKKQGEKVLEIIEIGHQIPMGSTLGALIGKPSKS
jgi:hypothetical protein